MSKRPISIALEKADLSLLSEAVSENVVFHSPILATVADEVRGREVILRVIGTAIAGFGVPQNVTEWHGADGRYIVSFEGVIEGHPLECTMTMTEDANGKVADVNTYLRPYPVVTYFREHMQAHLCPDPVAADIWALPASV